MVGSLRLHALSITVGRHELFGCEIPSCFNSLRFDPLAGHLADALGDLGFLFHQNVHVAGIEDEQAGAGERSHRRRAACLSQYGDLAEKMARAETMRRSGKSIATSPAATKYIG
jgi:hypothetical protein